MCFSRFNFFGHFHLYFEKGNFSFSQFICGNKELQKVLNGIGWIFQFSDKTNKQFDSKETKYEKQNISDYINQNNLF